MQIVNEMLASLKVQQHPDKTFIGKAERRFDFLGYAFKPGSLSVAKATLERARQKAHRLYEQGADVLSVGGYWRRFWRWVVSGVGRHCWAYLPNDMAPHPTSYCSRSASP
jgi:RNA-directed DNA polymerase